eukprot:s3762_g16.t1
MFYVDCQGRLLDKYEPSVKEQRAVAFTSWNGHAFFCKSARTVAKCEPIGERARYRGERKPGETPEFKQRPFPHRRPGAGPEGAPGRGTLPEGGHAKHERVAVRRELLAEGHCPKVVMRSMSEWRCLRLRGRGREDCVISAFHEDLDVLQAWMRRLGLPYYGQRLAGAGARSSFTSSRLAAIRSDLGKPCSRSKTISASSARPPSPQQNGLGVPHATTLESRFSRRAYERSWNRPEYRRSSSSSTATSRTTSATDCRRVECRKNGLAHAKFPTPIFCPKDNVEQAGEGHLADLTYVRLREDGRWLGGVQAAPLRGPGLERQACRGLHAGKGSCDLVRLRVQPGRHGARRTWTRSP